MVAAECGGGVRSLVRGFGVVLIGCFVREREKRRRVLSDAVRFLYMFVSVGVSVGSIGGGGRLRT